MRYTPIAAALSLFLAVPASVGHSQPSDAVDPRVTQLLETGRAALAAGDVDGATDRLEAALALDPGYTPIYLELAAAARANGLQGKAIHYYREAQKRDPGNLAAISGEGEAMVEKGAVAKAKRNLARLQSICGESCEAAVELASAIDRGPAPKVRSAEAGTPADHIAPDRGAEVVEQN